MVSSLSWGNRASSACSMDLQSFPENLVESDGLNVSPLLSPIHAQSPRQCTLRTKQLSFATWWTTSQRIDRQTVDQRDQVDRVGQVGQISRQAGGQIDR